MTAGADRLIIHKTDEFIEKCLRFARRRLPCKKNERFRELLFARTVGFSGNRDGSGGSCPSRLQHGPVLQYARPQNKDFHSAAVAETCSKCGYAAVKAPPPERYPLLQQIAGTCHIDQCVST